LQYYKHFRYFPVAISNSPVQAITEGTLIMSAADVNRDYIDKLNYANYGPDDTELEGEKTGIEDIND